MVAGTQGTVRIEATLPVDVEAIVGWLAEGARYVEAPATIGVDPGARWAAVTVPAERSRAGRGAKT